MKTATFCLYRLIPCFLHQSDDEEPMLIGTDWYVDMILSFVIWIDFEILKINKLPLRLTKLVLKL
jgi:hypothetical protein